MLRHAIVAGLALLMGACAAVKPMTDSELSAGIGDQIRPGPGLLSGPAGEFVLALP